MEASANANVGTGWQARIELAAAHRLAVLDGLSEGSWNHFSLAVPDDPQRILLTPPQTHWSQVTASNLIEVGPDFEEAHTRGATWTAYRIHYPIHQIRPDAACVLHAHPPHIVAMSMIESRLSTAEQGALFFHGRIAYNNEYDGLGPRNLEQGRLMAEALGDQAIALLLRGHGTIVVGPTVADAYTYLYLLERACQAQILAMSAGRPLLSIPEDVLATWDAEMPIGGFRGHFDAMTAVLDRREPDYRN